MSVRTSSNANDADVRMKSTASPFYPPRAGRSRYLYKALDCFRSWLHLSQLGQGLSVGASPRGLFPELPGAGLWLSHCRVGSAGQSCAGLLGRGVGRVLPVDRPRRVHVRLRRDAFHPFHEHHLRGEPSVAAALAGDARARGGDDRARPHAARVWTRRWGPSNDLPSCRSGGRAGSM